MKEISSIVEAYDRLKSSSVKLALATVIEVEGSSYRRTGARMLIQDNGMWTGGISGGCIEGNALKKANIAISGSKAVLVTYDTSNEGEESIGVSLGCNGVITVIISPINRNDKNNPVEQLRPIVASRKAEILITVIEAENGLPIASGNVLNYLKKNIELFAESAATITSDAITVKASAKSIVKTYPNFKLFLEYVPPAIHLIIMGGNYDIYSLLKVAGNLGWQTTVVGSKKRLDKEIVMIANEITEDFSDTALDDYCVGIIMGHDYTADLKNLQKCLKSTLKYIGLLGPAKRKEDMLAELAHEATKDQSQRIFGPAGLDIGASQPEEIAVSIVAEILSVMRKRPGSSLKLREGPIYSR